MNKKGFIKVQSASLMIPERDVKDVNQNGTFTPTPDFLELIYTQTSEFREPIITFINEVVPYNWAIYFTPFSETVFDAQIYCDNNEDFTEIVNIIKEKLTNKLIREYYLKGTINDIDTRW